MTVVAQETTIKRWIETVAGFASSNVFLGNGNGERPNSDYATFRFLTGGASVHSAKFVTPQEAPGEMFSDEDYVARESMTYQIDVYSENGKDIVNKLWLSRAVPSIRTALLAGGVTISTKSGTRNLTAFEDTSFVPRYSVDIAFLGEANLSTKDDLGFLNSLWDKFLIEGTWKPGLTVSIQSNDE